jgi:hypothetical protein
MKINFFLLPLILILFLLNSKTTLAQTSKYFPDNCWGVYNWPGWDTAKVNPKTHPLIKGVPLVFRWSELEPVPGKYKFDEVIGKKLELADKTNYYTFLMVWVAPNAPKWLYLNGVPEVKMTQTTDPFGKARQWPFQYYLDKQYILYYHRFLMEFGKYLQSLPKNLQDRVLYVQSAEGSTGDGGPYKGDPIDSKYNITKEQWGDFRINAWDVLKKGLTNEKGELVKPILVNYDANGEKENNWLLNNLPVIGLKNGMFSHGYHISETKTRLQSWRKFHQQAADKGIQVFSRGEQDGEWKIYGWSTKNTQQAFYWSGIFATYCGLDMWNVSVDASEGYYHKDGLNFFNKYAAQRDPANAKAAFCALRKGLDAGDTISYPESVYGKCERNNIDRYLKIAAAYTKYGAYQGDPEKAIGGGMLNRRRMDYNDVGWGISDSNYCRFIEQIDAEETSQGWWHIGPKESIYSRFARSIKTKEGKGGLYFDVNDVFAKECKDVEIRIVWLDNGNAEWTAFYNSQKKADKTLFTIKNTNTGKWLEKTVLVKDASFANKGERNSDIFITTKSNETAIFHMLELTIK